MPTNATACGEMLEPSPGQLSPSFAPEKSLWFEVIQLALWDYAHLQREHLRGYFMLERRREKLRRVAHFVFNECEEEGSMVDVVNAVATSPEYMLKSLRDAVSDEQILSGYVLGRKMRVDAPFEAERDQDEDR